MQRLDLNLIDRAIIREALDRAPIEVTDLGCHIWLGSEIARRFGVSPRAINGIKRGETWSSDRRLGQP